MKSYGVTIQMKPLWQYFHMVFFQPFTKRNLVAFSKLTLAISVRERVDAFSFLLNRFFKWI